MKPRNHDTDIREALVRRLLAGGMARDAIRHEVTLDSSSSDGRADLVVLRKSASDKLDRLVKQRPRYSARFDRIVLICDEKHKPWTGLEYYGWLGWECCGARGDHAGIEFDANYWTGMGALESPVPDWWDRSGHLSARAMLEMLWANEVREICAANGRCIGTRTAGIPWLAENVPLKELRKRVAAALKARALNRWEERFWLAFDAREAA